MKIEKTTNSAVRILLLLAIISLVAAVLVFRNRQYTYYLTIKPLVNPAETKVTANDQRLFLYSSDKTSATYVYYGNEKKLNLSVSNPGFRDVTRQVTIKNKETETIELEKKAPGEMNLEDFITVPAGQQVTWKKSFGNQTWALVGTNLPKSSTTDTIYVLFFDVVDYRWRVVISGVGITAENKKLLDAPEDLVKYLEVFYAAS